VRGWSGAATVMTASGPDGSTIRPSRLMASSIAYSGGLKTRTLAERLQDTLAVLLLRAGAIRDQQKACFPPPSDRFGNSPHPPFNLQRL
jgi:hypothetical protein